MASEKIMENDIKILALWAGGGWLASNPCPCSSTGLKVLLLGFARLMKPVERSFGTRKI